MQSFRQQGFTLIEVIVVAAIIAILAGIIVPLIFKEIDESKIARAQADARSIQSALFVMKKDTGEWPVRSNLAGCTASVTFLLGEGNLPVALPATWDQSSMEPIRLHASADNGCYTNWKGPYLATFAADPWGGSYVINAKDFYAPANVTDGVWIISAGPNQQIETEPGSAALQGDDIGLRIK